MADVTNIAATNTGAVSVLLSQVAAPTKTTTDTSAVAVTDSANDGAQGARFVNNPLARVLVTQFYDHNGQVASQVPSSTVIAYLENGLTADGSPKASATA